VSITLTVSSAQNSRVRTSGVPIGRKHSCSRRCLLISMKTIKFLQKRRHRSARTIHLTRDAHYRCPRARVIIESSHSSHRSFALSHWHHLPSHETFHDRSCHSARDSLAYLDRVVTRDPLVRWITVTVKRHAAALLYSEYFHIESKADRRIKLTDTVTVH